MFIKYLKERGLNRQTCILLLDQHSSHLFNLHFMEYMKAHNVEVYAFPPHTTHLLQPLDDTIFANFKNAYNARLLEMNFAKAGTKMNKYDFFKVFVPAFTSSMTYQSITKGFSNTGIYPYNPRTKKLKQVIPSHIFDKCKWPLPLCCCYVLVFFHGFFQVFSSALHTGTAKGYDKNFNISLILQFLQLRRDHRIPLTLLTLVLVRTRREERQSQYK